MPISAAATSAAAHREHQGKPLPRRCISKETISPAAEHQHDQQNHLRSPWTLK